MWNSPGDQERSEGIHKQSSRRGGGLEPSHTLHITQRYRSHSVRIAEIGSMLTAEMMQMRGAFEDAGMAGLHAIDRMGNFADDAGGIVGTAPRITFSGGGVYLVFLVRVWIV